VRNRLADLLSADSTSFFGNLYAHLHNSFHLALNSAGANRGDDGYEQEKTASQRAVVFKFDLCSIFDTKSGSEYYEGLIKNRSRREPRIGQCGAVLFTAVPAPPNVLDVEFVRDDTPPCGGAPVGSKNPPHIPPTDHSVGSTPAYSQLLLPHVVVQHDKTSDAAGTVQDQGRMALVSLLAFYSALGIHDHPFYCLLTTGTVCTILMGWTSSKQNASAPSVVRTLYSYKFIEPISD
jgi:hypothetical protein